MSNSFSPQGETHQTTLTPTSRPLEGASLGAVPSADEAVERLEYLGIAGGNSHSCGTAMLGKELDFFLEH